MATICAICNSLMIRSSSRNLRNIFPNTVNKSLQKRLNPSCNSTRLFTKSIIQHHKEGDLDELKKNPYYEKYSKKIEVVKSSATKDYLNNISINGQINTNEGDFLVTPSGELGSKHDVAKHNSQMSPEKKLEKILDVSLLADKTPEEISKIWTEAHQEKTAIVAVIPGDVWETLSSRLVEHNTFLLPLPRNDGYEYMVMQFEGKQAHFTSLYSYQRYGENSPECLNIVYYPDLVESKGIVLMSGEYDKNTITYEEATCLSVQLLCYYGVNSEPKKLAHLERFTYNTEEFSHFDLIAELESSKNIPIPSTYR